MVRAAHLPTFELLSRYWWLQETGRYQRDNSGIHGEVTLAPNTDGMAYVDEEDLITSRGSQAFELTAKARNPRVKPE